jgi:hypothetical protein
LSGEMGKAGEAGATGFAGGFKKIVGPAIAAAVAVAGVALVKFGKDSIAAGEAAATANARISNIAEKMGLFGNETATVSKRLIDLAKQQALATGVDQNSIKATQAKLLTFKELAKTADEVGGSFDRATAASLDLAAAGLGADAAVQLGKALQDPIKGMTALTKSGVTFTDAEKEKVKVLLESGKTLEAQNMILEAIETQVGGTALATANSSDRIKVAFSQLKESVGLTLLPAFDGANNFIINKFLIPLTAAVEGLPLLFEKVGTALKPFVEGFKNTFAQAGGGLQGFLAGLMDLRQKLFEAFMKALPAIIDAITEFIPTLVQNSVNMITQLIRAIVGALPEMIRGAVQLFNGIITALTQILPVIISAIVSAMPVLIKAIVNALPQIIQASITLFLGVIDGILKALPQIISALVQALPQIIKAITDALPLLIDGAIKLFLGIVDGLIKALPQIIQAVIKAMPKIIKALIDAVPLFIQAGIDLMGGLAKGILQAVPNVIGALVSGVGSAVDAFKKFLGIKSPSTVFAEFGGDLMRGLAVGVQATSPIPQKAVNEIFDDIQKVYNERLPVFFRVGEQVTTGIANGILSVGGKVADAMSIISKLIGQGVYGLLDLQANGLMADLDRLFLSLFPYGFAGAPTKPTAQTQGNFTQIMSAAGGGVGQGGVLDALFNQVTFEKGNKTTAISLAPWMDPETIARNIAQLEAEGFKAIKQVADRTGFLETVAAITEGTKSPAKAPATKKKKMARGGFVEGPTNALIGEYGPEIVVPLNKFEKWMGLGENNGKVINYYAAENKSIDSEQALIQAIKRAKVITAW